ncbi:kinase-like domain-containing protein, partial [Mycena galericulata]
VDDFEILLLIGRGSSSSVYLVRDKGSKKLYSLKVVPRRNRSSDVVEEQQVLKTFAGLPDAPRSLLYLVASWRDSVNSYLLTPWCGAKDFTGLFIGRPRFEKLRVKFYMAQLVFAVQCLHRLNIVHRDIKPGNIFLTKEGNVVLGDFGLAKRFMPSLMAGADEPEDVSFDVDASVSSGSFLKPAKEDIACLTQERCGTSHWMSPDQHAGTPYSFDTDAWSLGLLMFRMLTGRLPFGESATTTQQLEFSYAHHGIEFKDVDELDDVTKNFLQGLLTKDRTKRITMTEAKSHPYFAGVDWVAIARHQAPVPWVPIEPFVPKEGRANLLSAGVPVSLEAAADRSFSFVAPGF